MLGYRKKAFGQAFDYCHALKNDPSDLVTLLNFQELLLFEIQRAQTKIRSLKTERKSLLMTEEYERRLDYLDHRIDRVRQVVYVWKCFGDAIAFIYLDRFSLKQTYYNTHNVNVKQDAGFLIDKEGTELELTILRTILTKGIPCLLCDITDTIRYGDICLLNGDDPSFIEVKSSRKKDRRGIRQLRRLRKLSNFYTTDEALDFRGVNKAVRTTLQEQIKCHSKKLNDCIQEAIHQGNAHAHPEEGLYILVSRDGSKFKQELEKVPLSEKTIVFSFNSMKSERVWAPFYPFTLLINSKEALYDFIRGDLFILVFLDMNIVAQEINELGYQCEINLEKDFPLKVFREGSKAHMNVGHLVKRCGMEVLSPKWLAKISVSRFNNLIAQISKEEEISKEV